MENWFNKLSEIDVSSHIEEKNGLKYLSWMWAWQELKKRYPLSYSTVYETPEGMLVWPDPIGCHVKTSVTIVWQEEDGQHEHTVTEYLPVMDFKNRAIPIESVDSMVVNKTIQRSLTKCIARLGCGGYIYAGEDMPEESDEKKAARAEEAAKKAEELKQVINAISDEIAPIIQPMQQAEKKTFVETVIVPVLGIPNYKVCKDTNKLNQLLSDIKKYKEKAA